MTNANVKEVRSIAILSHGAAGKTSLAEAMGTPRAVDGAVIIVSALSGVKAETEKIYKFACDYEIPRVAFVSKLDKERADFFRAVGDMEKYFCKGSLVLQLPIGLEAAFSGVVDLIKMKALFFAKDNSGKVEEKDIPENMKQDAAAYRKKLVEQIAETEDSLLEKYLEKGDLSQEEIILGLKHGILTGGLLPVLCGSPVTNRGIQQLLDALITCLPTPVERAGIVPNKGTDPKTGKETVRKPLPEEPLSALVFKTIINPFA